MAYLGKGTNQPINLTAIGSSASLIPTVTEKSITSVEPGGKERYLVCLDGTCQEMYLTQEQAAARQGRIGMCVGMSVGQVCEEVAAKTAAAGKSITGTKTEDVTGTLPETEKFTILGRGGCEDDSECPGRQVCRGGQCVEPIDPDVKRRYVVCLNGICEEMYLDRGQADARARRIELCEGKSVGQECEPRLECGPNRPCPDPNQECVNGKCQDKVKKECENDSDCVSIHGPGWICDNGTCVKGKRKVEVCTNDEECIAKHGPGWYCSDGKCYEKKKRTITCETDQDCVDKYGAGYICQDGECVSGKRRKECDDDQDCASGYQCVNGQCIEKKIPGEDTPCDGGYKAIVPGGCGRGFHEVGYGGELWCCPDTDEEERLGEWTWPTGMEDLYRLMLQKAGEYGAMGPYGPEGKYEYPAATQQNLADMAALANRYLTGGEYGPEGRYEIPPALQGALTEMANLSKRYLAGDEYGGMGKFEWPTEVSKPYGTAMSLAEQLLQLGQFGGLGEFAYGEDIQGLAKALAGRGREFLEMPLGFSEREMETRFGRDYDVLRREGLARRRGMEGVLQREGLTGTGAEVDVYMDLAWQTERTISDLSRDVFLANEAQKREDLYGYSEAAQRINQHLMDLETQQESINESRRRYGLDVQVLAQNLLSQGMQYHQIQEAINQSRRDYGLDQKVLASNLVMQGISAEQAADAINQARIGVGMAQKQLGAGLVGQDIGAQQALEAINQARLGYGLQAQGAMGDIFGQTMGYNQIEEMLNAARRGESQDALSLLMQYLMTLMSSWG